MKKEELPQDESALKNFTREVCYVKNDAGEYETDLSKGWNVKKDALDNAWDDVRNRVEAARNAVSTGEKSPVYYFMELQLMDLPILAGYTGFWKMTIRRHMDPNVFNKLSEPKLMKYAKAFGVSMEELRNPK